MNGPFLERAAGHSAQQVQSCGRLIGLQFPQQLHRVLPTRSDDGESTAMDRVLTTRSGVGEDTPAISMSISDLETALALNEYNKPGLNSELRLQQPLHDLSAFCKPKM